VFVITVVFGGILCVFLYFYLFRTNKREKGSVAESNSMSVEDFQEEVARLLNNLFEEMDKLESKVSSVYDYLKEVVEHGRGRKKT